MTFCKVCGQSSHTSIKDCKKVTPVEKAFLDLCDSSTVILNDGGCWSLKDQNNNMTLHHPHHGTVYLTRLSYAVKRGLKYEQIPMNLPYKGNNCPMVVTNWCGTPRCLNPLHLIHMTTQGLRKKAIKNGSVKQGISDEDKREIRRKYRNGSSTQKELARDYQVSQPSISYIVNRWKDPILGDN